MKPTVDSIIEQLDIALAIAPTEPQTALRIAFMLGATSTVGLGTEQRAEAAKWLEREFENLMMELG